MSRACIASAIVLSLLWSLNGVSQKPVAQPKLPFVRVRFSDTTLHITYKDKKIDHDFRESPPNESNPEYKRFSPAAIESVKTQRLVQKDGQVYMLLDVSGPSRGPGAALSYCGAGTEKALVLFRLDSDGLLDEPQAVNYESCLYTIGDPEDSAEGSNPPSLESSEPLVIAFSLTRMRGPADPKDYMINRDLVMVEARFDPAHPNLGITTMEKVEDFKATVVKTQ